jgi:UDP-N-acetylglucosamine enolpyruvyl transferase
VSTAVNPVMISRAYHRQFYCSISSKVFQARLRHVHDLISFPSEISLLKQNSMICEKFANQHTSAAPTCQVKLAEIDDSRGVW